eukprot:6476975-Amphidinium_carterae.2
MIKNAFQNNILKFERSKCPQTLKGMLKPAQSNVPNDPRVSQLQCNCIFRVQTRFTVELSVLL